jgi:hypothetical protein
MNYKILQLPYSDFEILNSINLSLVFPSYKADKLFKIEELYDENSLTISYNSINQKLTVLNDLLDPYCYTKYYWSPRTIRDEMYEYSFLKSSLLSSEKRLRVTESILKELE